MYLNGFDIFVTYSYWTVHMHLSYLSVVHQSGFIHKCICTGTQRYIIYKRIYTYIHYIYENIYGYKIIIYVYTYIYIYTHTSFNCNVTTKICLCSETWQNFLGSERIRLKCFLWFHLEFWKLKIHANSVQHWVSSYCTCPWIMFPCTVFQLAKPCCNTSRSQHLQRNFEALRPVAH